MSAVLLLPLLALTSFPPGVTYPLKPADLQPSGLAQPLPSTRRYVLVWKDQLVPDTLGAAEQKWIVTHYVGTQKLFQRQIDLYRALNPNFLMLTYHLAYGLNGADQTHPVGNITAPNSYGQEDTDTFTPYVQQHLLARENAYQHGTSTGFDSNRIYYPDPFWLMDIASPEWTEYLTDTLLAWQAFPTAKATGTFFDVAFFPWYNYQPASWWGSTQAAGNPSRTALRDWWNPRATAYFNGLRAAFAPTAQHPRYLVIPNPDALTDATDDPQFLNGTDGVFTENWQNAALGSAGDFALSAGRVLHYVTAHAKVWIADVTEPASTTVDRERIIAAYFLLRNGTSYLMLGNSDVTWYPEYEIDLGGYLDEPPDDFEQLRVAGTGGSSGGLYARKYVSGLVLDNTSSGALSYVLPSAMKRVLFSGGGAVTATGAMAAETLTYSTDVAAGPVAVPAHSAILLRDPAGAPPPGVEPVSAVPDGGVGFNADGGIGAFPPGVGNGMLYPPIKGSGCQCSFAPRDDGRAAISLLLFGFLAGLAYALRKARASQRAKGS